MVTVIPTSISTPESGILHVYPNPVLSITTIVFQMPGPGDARIEIHNMAGQLVGVVVNGYKPAGPGPVRWDPGSLPSGIYICSLRAGPEVIRRKIILSR